MNESVSQSVSSPLLCSICYCVDYLRIFVAILLIDWLSERLADWVNYCVCRCIVFDGVRGYFGYWYIHVAKRIQGKINRTVLALKIIVTHRINNKSFAIVLESFWTVGNWRTQSWHNITGQYWLNNDVVTDRSDWSFFFFLKLTHVGGRNYDRLSTLLFCQMLPV